MYLPRLYKQCKDCPVLDDQLKRLKEIAGGEPSLIEVNCKKRGVLFREHIVMYSGFVNDSVGDSDVSPGYVTADDVTDVCPGLKAKSKNK